MGHPIPSRGNWSEFPAIFPPMAHEVLEIHCRTLSCQKSPTASLAFGSTTCERNMPLDFGILDYEVLAFDSRSDLVLLLQDPNFWTSNLNFRLSLAHWCSSQSTLLKQYTTTDGFSSRVDCMDASSSSLISSSSSSSSERLDSWTALTFVDLDFYDLLRSSWQVPHVNNPNESKTHLLELEVLSYKDLPLRKGRNGKLN